MAELPHVAEALGTFALNVPQLPLRAGEVLGVFGRSGSGKSSYLRALLRRFRDSEAQLLPQDDDTLADLTVEQNVMLGALSRGSVADTDSRALLATLHLTPYSNRRAASLSGGQRRRVAIARVLSAEPRLLLLDEPFNGLGRHYETILTAELERRAQGGSATVIVSHDLQLLSTIAKRILVLHEGTALDVLVNGVPQTGWTRLIAEIIGVSNILSVRALRAIGTLSGLDSLPDACAVMAWRDWTLVDSTVDARLRFEFPVDVVQKEISYRTEGSSYTRLRLCGPDGPVEVSGVEPQTIHRLSDARVIAFVDFMLSDCGPQSSERL